MKMQHAGCVGLLTALVVVILQTTPHVTGTFTSDHQYSVQGRDFSYDTVLSLDQGYTIDECSVM